MKRYVVPPSVLAQDLVPLIAHDLRTPVTAIKGYSQLILRQAALPPHIGGYLTSVVDEANQIASLIDDLVMVSQIERRTVTCQPTDVDLGLLVQRVAESINATSPAPLTVDSTQAAVLAFCDPNLTKRAIVRLAQFAMKYCQSSEAARMGQDYLGDQCYVWIATRPVAAPGSAVMSPTNSPDTSAAPDDDLGRRDLRMYICARLAELQNGSVGGSMEANEGHVFYLLLPSAAMHAPQTAGG